MKICMCIIIGLVIIIIVLLLCLLFLHRSIREVTDELDEKLHTDTNTLISISSGDRSVQLLATQINMQLKALRKERLRLQNGDAELKTAVTNISHDLRTPLTTISGYLQLLEHEEKSEVTNRYLNLIKNRTMALNMLTHELFNYSVITSQTDLHIELVSINAVLEESLATSYSLLTQKGIIPKIMIPNIKVERALDCTALCRIFENIISNAAKYSDGDFTVNMGEDGQIEFSNTAHNLDSVSVERLFDRFYTVETGNNSTGLGLSIAKMLTERMGGSILAELIHDRLVINIKFIQ